jgi:aminoglycoside/choline kinase family phosphotransferase
MSNRRALSNAFLDQIGWGMAERRFLAGDASDRSYDRLWKGEETAVLMDAPPGKGDDPATFIAIAEHLSSIGLSPPLILAKDLTHGFLLIEDLGDDLLARLAVATPEREVELYRGAVDVLIKLQSHPAPEGQLDLTARDWAIAAGFCLEWYAYAATGSRPDSSAFILAMTRVLQAHADGPRVMILRDYHAENLLLLSGRTGAARIGLLDFQLAQMGQPGYDLVSLLQDARRDVSAKVQRDMIDHFTASMGLNRAEFEVSFAVLGAQRALRILGVFARLCLVAGKRDYLGLIPRVWGQLWTNLAHPALAEVQDICRSQLPQPTPKILDRIAEQCAKSSL